jgi:hypothetical protein
MMTRSLLEKVSKMGFPLLETEGQVDVNGALADVVKSKEIRLWEAFPTLLAYSEEKALFSDPAVRSRLTEGERHILDSLLCMSLGLYRFFALKFSWVRNITYTAALSDQKLRAMEDAFKNKREVRVGPNLLSAGRVATHFRNYFHREERDLKGLLSRKEEFALEYALAQVFSPKQKELFLKKMRGARLSKTEREYYSRCVRKKVTALANEELHRLAKSL